MLVSSRYFRTILATAIAVPLAALALTSYVALFRSADSSCALHQFSELPKALPWVYIPAVIFLVLYLLPSQWLLNKLAHGNKIALSLVWLAPSIVAAAASNADWSLRSLFVVGSTLTTMLALVFGAPANNSSKPTPLRGAA